jgi:RNA polymerase sigma factor (sigma-70 family)
MSPLVLSLRLLQAQPDARLLSLASKGHEPAFEALVRRYRRPLLAYCRRLTRPDASAEDILQQALLQAWRALSAGVEVRDARAWLYRIVRNAAISSARGGGEPHVQLGEGLRTSGVEQVVEQRLAAHAALAGLAALPELQREVMLETALEGRSHEEVATALGLTAGSVRGLVYRARATLRSAAAAVIPAPLTEWAIRQQQTSRGGSAAVLETVIGGGSAGVAGVLLKGGAILTAAGALAGTAAVVTLRPAHHDPRKAAVAAPHAGAVRGAAALGGAGVIPAAYTAADTGGRPPTSHAVTAAGASSPVHRATSSPSDGAERTSSGAPRQDGGGRDEGGSAPRGTDGNSSATHADSSATPSDQSGTDGGSHSGQGDGTTIAASSPNGSATGATRTPESTTSQASSSGLDGGPQTSAAALTTGPSGPVSAAGE